MKEQWSQPILLVSKCLEFEACRYNGQRISDPLIQQLGKWVTFKTVCPEVEIGMGIPREAVRLIDDQGKIRMVGTKNGNDFTEKMNQFSKIFVDQLETIDGCILKSRSPSCGINDAKIYPGLQKGSALRKENGLFAEHVMKRYGTFAVEHEGRLKDARLRHHFLTKLFTLSRFREVKVSKQPKALVKFQSDNKLLFMGYSQKHLRSMGQLVGRAGNSDWDELMKSYESLLHSMLEKPIRLPAHINVLMHAFGYFSKEMQSTEKQFFLESLEQFRNSKISLHVLIHGFKGWNARFQNAYLAQQTYFNPYPEELVVRQEIDR